MGEIELDGRTLTIAEVVRASDGRGTLRLADAARERVLSSRRFLKTMADSNALIYGVNTGTGPNVRHTVPAADMERLQANIVRMLGCGLGRPLPTEIVRATMVVRANSLARGHSGVRVELVERLIELCNLGVHPVIREQGSVGASGDLVPLAQMAAPLMGEGMVEYRGEVQRAGELLPRLGLEPLAFSLKEGLALVNGTSLMAAIGARVVHASLALLSVMEGVSAFAAEILQGTEESYDPRIQAARPYPGQALAARNILALLAESGHVRSARELASDLERERNESAEGRAALSRHRQDPYCLRTAPQVLGAVRDMLELVRGVVTIDINAASDNPLVFADDGEILHGGNFQGYHVAMAMDVAALALNQVGILSERRLARYVDAQLSLGLSPFLSGARPGLNNGLMGVQLVATSLVAENRLHATPASIQSIPTNANNQDLVSMGALAARKCLPVVENVQKLLAIELVALCQAAEERGVSRLGTASRMIYRHVRDLVAPLADDRALGEELLALHQDLAGGGLAEKIERLLPPPAIDEGRTDGLGQAVS
jgi:histidine ammonia-lyase